MVIRSVTSGGPLRGNATLPRTGSPVVAAAAAAPTTGWRRATTRPTAPQPATRPARSPTTRPHGPLMIFGSGLAGGTASDCTAKVPTEPEYLLSSTTNV